MPKRIQLPDDFYKHDFKQLAKIEKVYVIAKGKGKDHKQYEYGNKVSIVSTKDNNIIVGVV
jgi:IS5 family transposase